MRGVSESMASGHSPMLLQAAASALGDVWPGRLFPREPIHHTTVSRQQACPVKHGPTSTHHRHWARREREIRADLTSLQWLLSVLHWLWSVTHGRRQNGQIDTSAVLRALCRLGYSSPETGRLACFRDMHYACHHLLKFAHGRTHKL